MKKNIDKIREILESQIKANEVYLASKKKISESAGEYTVEALHRFKEDLKNRFIKDAEGRRDEILDQVNEMKAKEKINVELADNRLSNAVTILLSFGKDAPSTVLKSIENQFTGDQTSLATIKGVYERLGISTYSIEKKIYNVDSTYNELAQTVYNSFKNAEYIGKLSEIFGILKMIETANEVDPEDPAEIIINKLPKMI